MGKFYYISSSGEISGNHTHRVLSTNVACEYIYGKNNNLFHGSGTTNHLALDTTCHRNFSSLFGEYVYRQSHITHMKFSGYGTESHASPHAKIETASLIPEKKGFMKLKSCAP